MHMFSLIEGLNTNDLPNTSPNSGNFAIILDTLYNTLKADTSIEVTVLLLQWLKDILINSENYLEALYTNEKFSKLADVIVDCGYNFNPRIVLSVCENLEKLLSNKQLSWSSTFLTNVSDLCKLHMTSTKEEIRNCYSRLLANIPWDITIAELNKVNTAQSLKEKCATEKKNLNYAVYLGQQLHLNGSIESELYPLQFKQLTKYLLKNEPMDISQMEDIFSSCWLSDSDSLVYSVPYDELASNSSVVLYSWLTLEAAQFCVTYKLRTPLGKPNETFTKIEGALNQLGNELITLKKHGGDGDDNHHETTTVRVRLLLYFVENLEKAIYNASEGCVAAMPSAHKAVKSFFVANANTCCEWFARIRLVATHVALHSGEPSVALRHGQAMVKDLVATGKTNTTEFEILCMIVTLALLYLKEPESLYGFYSWCKNTVGKKYHWIKHAGEQAAKKYELALEGYKKVLQDKGALDSSTDKKLEPDIQNFIMDQIVVCYKELSNWVELFDWHDKQQGVTENGKKYWFNKTDWECNKILFDMESDNLAFEELSSWDYKENKSWSVYENLNTTESNLYNVALKLTMKKDQDLVVKTEENILSIQRSIQEFLPLAPSEFLQTYSLLHYVANGLKQVAYDSAAHTAFLVSESFEKEIQKVDSCVLRKILWWSEHFGKIQNQGFNVFCSNLRLDVIKRARKEKNYKLAASHILKFFKDKDLIVTDQSDIDSVIEVFVNKVQEVSVWTMDIAKAVAEVIKVSYAISDHATENTFNLCAVASTSISKYAELFGVKELRQVSTKILLKLASCLQSNEDAPLTDINSPLGKLILVLPEIGMVENIAASMIPQNEVAVGKLLHFCVHHCATLAKSWNVFGSWCYRWGKKIVDHSSGIKNNLSEEHCQEIKQLLPVDTPEEDVAKIFRILSQTRSVIDEEDIDPNEIKTSEMILSQLQCVQALGSASEEQLQSLVQIWRNTQKRIYHYYALSADAYFRYLHLVQQPENVSKSSEFNTVTITLRLLRLIVKYALELQTILEEGLQTTPTQPWKVIIPQLFSRLNHPESYVRLRVSDLLCRVAEDAPHLITFPAVVGALEGGLKFDFSEIKLPKDCLSQEIDESNDDIEMNDEDEDNNYDSDGEETVNTMQSCFKTMVDTLSKQDPETISQVRNCKMSFTGALY
ncbi:unnamed protein product [Acanthoscelides obtectus]|uniref:FAT domain-containing protein n=1 Tax=Acanthoscelides obtectus TaxID=200917 RepID=A0A9P0PIJ4_ACAOB|nr:unnamed protein product [Acanthoscelides obtectus]CAK1625570.1 Serine/threonine-protein kinase Smg1 [Acanthoscelides obtectus]